jgi:hypothetical protein
MQRMEEIYQKSSQEKQPKAAPNQEPWAGSDGIFRLPSLQCTSSRTDTDTRNGEEVAVKEVEVEV